jgi:hypothetical protein
MGNEPMEYEVHEEMVLAHRLARAYRDAIDVYQREAGLDVVGAVECDRAAGYGAVQRVLTAAPDDISWRDIGQALEQDLTAARAGWARLQALATDELASGHRSARALGDMPPMERARFLALLASFREAWLPRGGLEESLIASAAQAYTAYECWLSRVQEAAGQEAAWQAERLRASGHWSGPAVSLAETLEQAASMAERFQRMLVRSVRALRDLRRLAPNVVVQSANQVNIAETQLNMAASEGSVSTDP